MLVTFSSKADADILMMGDHAKTVLKLAGKQIDDTVPERGVFSVEQLPEAIAKLKAAMAAEKPQHNEDDPDEPKPHPLSEKVSLAQRAYPLLNMMQKAQAANAPVLWEVGSAW